MSLKGLAAIFALFIVAAAWSDAQYRHPPPPVARAAAVAQADTPAGVPPVTMSPNQPGRTTSLEDIDVRFAWRREGPVFVGAFRLTNGGTAAIKDIRIACSIFAPSGTALQTKTATVYEAIGAKASKQVTGLDMGFLHPQAASAFCKAVDFTTI